MLEPRGAEPAPAADPIKSRRIELGRFLRERRARLRPADVAQVFPGRRHVRGLRRDEVAAIAEIGVSWYTMLEQGRVENVSVRTLAAVARALRLSGSERAHLFALAARSFEELNIDPTPPPPELVAFVERTTVGMAFIVSPWFDVVAYNELADRFFRFSAHGPAPNILRIMVGDPLMRDRFIEPRWHAVLTRMMGHFRVWHGRVGGAPFDALVTELRRYPEFAAIWDERVIVPAPSERSLLTLPDVGPFSVNVMAFTSFVCPTYTIMFKTLVEPDLLEAEDVPSPHPDHALPFAAIERHRRADLGAFLRHCRERTRPQDIGLVPIGRRHAKGLRRDEVAERAGIGVSWYTMLEQGRVENVTQRTLRSVADALALSHRERLYLERLTVQSFAEFDGFDRTAHADLIRFVQHFPDGHAHFHDAHFQMIAWNELAGEFYGYDRVEQPNLLELMVRNPRLRDAFVAPTWAEALKRMLAHYRFTHALFGESESDATIAALVAESPEFAAIWLGDRSVLNPATEPGLLRCPDIGLRSVDVLLLTPVRLPTHTLVLKIATPDQPSTASTPSVPAIYSS